MAHTSVPRRVWTVLLAVGIALATAAPASASPRQAWDLISGQLIRSSSGIQCTLGFNVHSGTTSYVLSAGHCLDVGTNWYGVGGYIGPAAASSFPADDYGLIRVESPDATPTPLVDRHSSGGDVTVIGARSPYVGMPVCYSNPVAGWHCGSITAVNQTVCYPQGCVYQMARSNLCPQPGPSGSPVVTRPTGGTVYAVGLLSGASGNCSSGGTTWIQPISEPLARYGMTLHTG